MILYIDRLRQIDRQIDRDRDRDINKEKQIDDIVHRQINRQKDRDRPGRHRKRQINIKIDRDRQGSKPGTAEKQESTTTKPSNKKRT